MELTIDNNTARLLQKMTASVINNLSHVVDGKASISYDKLEASGIDMEAVNGLMKLFYNITKELTDSYKK
jgi:hypothetical protein